MDSSFIAYGRAIINWKLFNFTKELLDADVVTSLPALYSPDFRIRLSNYETTKWKFLASRNKSELTLYLKNIDDVNPSMRYGRHSNYIIKYDVQLRDQVNERNVKRTSGKLEMYHEDKLGKIINLRDCLRPRSYRILYNSTVHVIVYLEIIKKKVDIANIFNTTLSSHYEKMFNNKSFSDFLIITSEDQEIYVHKNILAMRSPVFEAMINSSMKEGNEKKVKIDDIDGKSLYELVRFIYSGKVNEIDCMANELLYAANKYDIQDLKPLCVESLAINISIDNVIETFILADLHREKFLKIFCMDFIKWKYPELKENSGWESFSHQTMKEILDYIMSPAGKKDETTVITNIKRTAPRNVVVLPDN